MGVFSFFGGNKSNCFCVDGSKYLTIEQFSKEVMALSHRGMKETIDDFIHFVPENILFSNVNNAKPITMCILSFHLSIYLARINERTNFPSSKGAELVTFLLNEIKTLKNTDGSRIWDDSEIDWFGSYVSKYFKEEIEKSRVKGRLKPTILVVDDIFDLYQLHDSEFIINKIELSTYFNSIIELIDAVITQKLKLVWVED